MWNLTGKLLKSRLLLGTASYPSLTDMDVAIRASGTEVITLAIKRQTAMGMDKANAFWSAVKN